MGIEFFFSNDQLSQSWKLIYDELNFPFEVRFHLDEWLEKFSWDDLKRSENGGYSADVYKKLIEELDKKITEKSSLDKLKILQLQTAKARIVDQFETRPSELVDVLQKCFSSERLLIESTKTDDDRHQTEEDAELLKYREKEKEIRAHLQQLKPRSQRLELVIDKFHTFMQESVSSIKDLQEAWNQEMVASKDNERVAQQANAKIEQYRLKIQTTAQQITENKKLLVKELVECSKIVAQCLNKSWTLVQHYKLQQKQSVCFLAKPPEGAIDTLNKVCEESSRQLKAHMLYVDKVLADVNLLLFQGHDEEKLLLEKLRSELLILLGKHLEEIFLITKQPQNVQKIVQNKSPSLSMCVRLLGGLGLGIEHSLPSVTVRVYAEQRLKDAMEAEEPKIEGMCKTVENGNGILMELKRATGHIQANLNNVQLRGVERLEKKMKDDRVTEHKYGMVFYTKVNVCNKIFPLRALSLPIVLTSQTSQNGAAKGTLIWDAAFSQPTRKFYEEEASVQWSEVEVILRAMFQDTGRSLEQDQLNYIAYYIFRNCQGTQEEDFSKFQLTKERFMRDKVPSRDFTFWRWIYACKNLIENHVSQEWKDRMIYGFIGRHRAEQLLSGHPPGTFLLRFRERKLEDSQRASKCACLALAVVGCDPQTGEKKVDHVKDHLTPTDIHKYTLTRILNSLVDVQTKQPLLRTLYPDTDFQSLVKQYLPDVGDTSIGYNPTRLLIGVHMNNARSDHDDSASESPLSPTSSMGEMNALSPTSSVGEMNALSPSSNFCDISRPDLDLSEDLRNIHVDPIMDTQDNLDTFLTNDGTLLMLCSAIEKRIDPLIPTSVCELDDRGSDQSTPTSSPKRKSLH